MRCLGVFMTDNSHAQTPSPDAVSSNLLSQQLQTLIDEAGSEPTVDERRTRDRFPIPYTFRLTPIDHAGNLLIEETSTVVGRDLSLSGIGFSHDAELKYPRAVISLNHPKIG